MGTKTSLSLLLLLLVVPFGGCGGSSTADFESIPPGDEGGACLQGAVCSDGLTCESGVCGQHWKWDLAGLGEDGLAEGGSLGDLTFEADAGDQPEVGGQDLEQGPDSMPSPDLETQQEVTEPEDSQQQDSLSGPDSSPDTDQGCIPQSHDSWDCFAGDLWWFDSCGEAEEVRETCPAGCANKACAEVCADECAVNQTGCNGNLQRWYCGLAGDGDPCRDKLYETCEGNTACSAGQCLETCDDECSPGERDCDDDQTRWYCGEAGDGDSCRDIIYASCSNTQVCDGGDCLTCTKHDYQDCVFNTVVWFDCKGVSNDTVKDCGLCSCASAQCSCGPSSVIIDSHDATGWSMGSPSDSIFKASDHTDGSPDGWFNTKGYNKNIRYTPNFGGDGTYGRWRTSQALTGVYKLYYHVPDPDSYDPYLGLYSVKSWIRCSSVKYWVKTMSNQAGDGLGVTASQSSPGWNLLGSYSFQNTVGEVTLKDYNASPSKCAVAFDAIKWELQSP